MIKVILWRKQERCPDKTEVPVLKKRIYYVGNKHDYLFAFGDAGSSLPGGRALKALDLDSGQKTSRDVVVSTNHRASALWYFIPTDNLDC